MSDFDPFDDELGAALRRRAGAGSDSTAAAHDAVLRRASTIRRRRAAIGGSGGLAVLVLGGIMLLPGSADEIGPAVTGDVLPTFEEPSTTTAVAVPSHDPTDDPTGAAPSSSSETTSTVAAPAPTNTISTSSTSTSDTSAPSSSAPTTSEPSQAVAPFTDTYQSVGGSITVTWSGSAFTLQAVSPAPGFVADVEDSSAARVRVRFEGADDDSRIEVRVADGRLSVDID